MTQEKTPDLFVKIIKDALFNQQNTADQNEADVQSVLSILAYYLIGGNAEKIIYIIVGPKHTGKSKLWFALQKILGTYYVTINTKSLMKSNRSIPDIRPDIISVRHARLIAASEAETNEKFDSTLLKTLSGSDEQSFRRPHGTPLSFTLKGKFALSTNNFPAFSNIDDSALIDRFVITEFLNTVPEEERILDMEEKLKVPEMLDRIFTLLCKKAHEYIETENLNVSPTFLASKERLVLSQSDSVVLFWKACILVVSTICTINSELIKYYVEELYSCCYISYCTKKGIPIVSLTRFGKSLKDIAPMYPDIRRWEDSKGIFYMGIQPTFEYMQKVIYERIRDVTLVG